DVSALDPVGDGRFDRVLLRLLVDLGDELLGLRRALSRAASEEKDGGFHGRAVSHQNARRNPVRARRGAMMRSAAANACAGGFVVIGRAKTSVRLLVSPSLAMTKSGRNEAPTATRPS